MYPAGCPWLSASKAAPLFRASINCCRRFSAHTPTPMKMRTAITANAIRGTTKSSSELQAFGEHWHTPAPCHWVQSLHSGSTQRETHTHTLTHALTQGCWKIAPPPWHVENAYPQRRSAQGVVPTRGSTGMVPLGPREDDMIGDPTGTHHLPEQKIWHTPP